jgi:hypothetical protein
LHNSLDEDLVAMLSGLISLIVLDLGGPSSFGVHMVNARSFHLARRVVAYWTGGWAYKRSILVVEVPVRVGSKPPEVVHAVDMVVGGLERDRRDGI